jgi:septal ring factor EnvC (AmiA/AmiB activator)
VPKTARAILISFLIAGAGPTPQFNAPVAAAAARSGDDFLIVDCMLPGRIRQLGTSMTFLAPRQVVRASAHECAVRGGEFTQGDAGGPAGLKMWLPAAERGDPVAQDYVGEIFERGLGGGPPDYGAAAVWYRKAADQGNARAAISLGTLIEQGLGVPRDPVAAARLFRRAAGLPEDMPEGDTGRVQELTAQLAAATASDAAKQKQITEQQAELDRLHKQLGRRRSELDSDRKNLAALQDRLAQLRQQATVDGGPPASQPATKQLMETLNGQQQELERSKSAVADLQAKLAALEHAAQQQQVTDSSQTTHLRNELAGARAAMAAEQQEKDRLTGELRRAQGSNAVREQELGKTLAGQEEELARTKSTVADLRAKLAALEPAAQQEAQESAQIEQLRKDLADARAAMAAGQKEKDRLAGALEETQGSTASRAKEQDAAVARLEQEVKDRQASVAAKDAEIDRLKSQVTQLEAADTDTPTDSKRSAGAVLTAGAALPMPVQAFGHYHALVIGINNYQRLPHLDTPINDAKEVASLLRDQYGFDVVTLFDDQADRYHILNALNDFRQSLTDKDNLLIYYAGHGEMDTVNRRGNWLPVDAEPNSNANWISNIQITDILNAMAAKQIMIVADSCYSGMLTRGVSTELTRTQGATEKATWYKIMIAKPSRVALTSGGLEPVTDSGGGGHSLFAKLFLQILRANAAVIAGQEVFAKIEPAVATTMANYQFHQVPEYSPIKLAGHEAGDFLFVSHRATAE